MARKLTESQKLIRRLQSRYTNKEIASLIGYKSPSTVSRIASGKATLIDSHRSLVDTIITNQNIRKSVPSKTELTQARKTIRKARKEKSLNIIDIVSPNLLWKQSTLDDFYASIDVPELDNLEEKITRLGLTTVYYNTGSGKFLLSNVKLDLSNIDPRDIQYFLFYFLYEVDNKQGHYTRVDFPMYRWQYILKRNDYKTFNELDYELYQFTLAKYSDDAMDKEEDFYSFVGTSEEVHFLAYVHEE